MGQCKTLDGDVTIECYYGGCRSRDNTIPTSLFIWNNFFFAHTFLPHFFSKHVLVTAKLCMHIYYCHIH